jgi:subtilase family serine protease
MKATMKTVKAVLKDRSAVAALAAAAFGIAMAVSSPLGAQTPQAIWVPTQPIQPGVAYPTSVPKGAATPDGIHLYFPADLQAAYNLTPLYDEGVTGQGQTIVIVDSYGSPTALADLQQFSADFGLPDPDLTIIYPNGKPTYSKAMHGAQEGWAGEVSLDLQWAHAIAPGARLVLIACNPAETQGVQGFPSIFQGIQYAVDHYPGSVISQSFGVTEQSFNAAAAVQIAKFRQVYQNAVNARCTVLAASGDWGTAMSDKQGRVYPFPTVGWPASDPLVTAVGGTQLQYGWKWNPLISITDLFATGDLASYLNYDPSAVTTEPVWREDWLQAATGGGLSAIFTTPGFQQGLDPNLLQGRRGVPDIACNAAVNGGVLVYFGFEGISSGLPTGYYIVGGTSAATPEIAGMVALANQLRSQDSKPPVGYLNPVLYSLPPACFNDIVPETFGTGAAMTSLDDNSIFGSGIPGFPTTAGWDLTTGFGSPNAYNFVHAVAAAP